MLVTALLSLALVSAQQNCDQTLYESCKQELANFKASTCDPYQSKNATLYSICLCYYDVNYANCFLQCPSNSTVQAEQTAFQATLTSDCAAASLNPKALPPAPWQTYIPTTNKPSASGTSGPAASASSSASASPTPKGNSAVSSHLMGGLFGITALLVMML